MSPDTTTDIINAVRRSIDNGDAAETACSLVFAARTLVDNGDAIGRVFLARTMLKVAHQLDPDVVLSPDTQ